MEGTGTLDIPREVTVDDLFNSQPEEDTERMTHPPLWNTKKKEHQPLWIVERRAGIDNVMDRRSEHMQ